MTSKVPPRRIAFFVAFCSIMLVAYMLIAAGVKYALYERPNAAPRLRNAIGKEVKLRIRDSSGRCEEFQGRLMLAQYRLNDEWGFFDLAIHVEGIPRVAEKGVGSQTASIYTGISPSEAIEVEVLSEHN